MTRDFSGDCLGSCTTDELETELGSPPARSLGSCTTDELETELGFPPDRPLTDEERADLEAADLKDETSAQHYKATLLERAWDDDGDLSPLAVEQLRRARASRGYDDAPFDEDRAIRILDTGNVNLKRQTKRVLACLTPREREVMARRFGFADDREAPVDEQALAAAHDATLQRLKKIEEAALKAQERAMKHVPRKWVET